MLAGFTSKSLSAVEICHANGFLEPGGYRKAGNGKVVSAL